MQCAFCGTVTELTGEKAAGLVASAEQEPTASPQDAPRGGHAQNLLTRPSRAARAPATVAADLPGDHRGVPLEPGGD